MKNIIRNLKNRIRLNNKKFGWNYYLAFCIVILFTFSFTACNKSKNNDDNVSEEQTDKTDKNDDEVKDILEADRPEDDAESDEATDAMSEEDNSIDLEEGAEVDGESAFDEQQHPFTFEDLYHNVYTGTIGDENVIVDIYPNMEENTVKIRYVGTNHPDKVEFDAEYPNEYSIIYSNKDLGIYLCEFEDGVISGTYYIKGDKSLPITLKLSHINYMADSDIFYTVGNNEDIEAFAKKIKEIVATKDMKSMAQIVSYPITLKNNEEVNISSQADFVNLNIDSVFTPELIEAINNAFPAFMFCNAEGVMLGNGDYNIWFSYMEDGSIKVIAINN